jgi:hypothetical protein
VPLIVLVAVSLVSHAEVIDDPRREEVDDAAEVRERGSRVADRRGADVMAAASLTNS